MKDFDEAVLTEDEVSPDFIDYIFKSDNGGQAFRLTRDGWVKHNPDFFDVEAYSDDN